MFGGFKKEYLWIIPFFGILIIFTFGYFSLTARATLEFEETALDIQSGDYFCGGDGTIENPYLICDWHHLNNVRLNLSANYLLNNSLDNSTAGYFDYNSGAGWKPIGNLSLPFVGNFSGGNKNISGLYINRPNEDHIGLFSFLSGSSIISNLCFLEFNFSGKNYVGVLVGRIENGVGGMISNSSFYGEVSGFNYVGGLVGYQKEVTISNSSFYGEVSGSYYVGGLVGQKWSGKISNSSFYGRVSGSLDVGGLIGYISSSSVISNSYAQAIISGSFTVGGLVGEQGSGGIISNSSFLGNVSGYSLVGGLVGRSYGKVIDSSFLGNVSGSSFVGGLVGTFNPTRSAGIYNSYYPYDLVRINGELHVITSGAISSSQFNSWISSGKFLDVNDFLSCENQVCLINNVSDFKQLLFFGQSTELNFSLNSDLNLSVDENFYIPYFTGNFDGKGHKIVNQFVFLPNISGVGLFGYLVNSSISNLNIFDSNIFGLSGVGILGGRQFYGTISNSSFYGNVSGSTSVGGSVGHQQSAIISNSSFYGNVSGSTSVGGLVGSQSYATILNSRSYGNVSGSRVGGLVGNQNHGTISNSFSISNLGFSCNNQTYLSNSISKGASCVLENHYLELKNSNLSFEDSSLEFKNSNLSFDNSSFSLINSFFNNSIFSFSSINSSIDFSSINSSIKYNISNSYLSFSNRRNFIDFEDSITSSGSDLEKIYSISSPLDSVEGDSFSGEGISITLNTSKDVNFNKSAVVSFNLIGWRVINGSILHDGKICNSATFPSCDLITSLDGGLIQFNVSSWSTYGINGTFDRSCGNGVLDEELLEVCDGNFFGGLTCADFGNFNRGNLVCSSSCDEIDYSSCYYQSTENTGGTSTGSSGRTSTTSSGSSIVEGLVDESSLEIPPFEENVPEVEEVIAEIPEELPLKNNFSIDKNIIFVIVAFIFLILILLLIFFIFSNVKTKNNFCRNDIRKAIYRSKSFLLGGDLTRAFNEYNVAKNIFESNKKDCQDLFSEINSLYTLLSKSVQDRNPFY